MNSKIKIALIAGEDSGDLLGSKLIQGLKTLDPKIEFLGVGGPKMKKAGMKLILSNDEFSIMGLFEVIKKLPRLLRLRKNIVQRIISEKPDLFIGIDAPDLNFPIEKKLKLQGTRIIHYVSPSIWAWRPKRAIKISQITDLVMTLFPFEPDSYKKAGGNAVFVGHPLAQNIALSIDKKESKKNINLNPEQPVLAVLPGSRSNELKSHTELFFKATAQFIEHTPGLQVVSANTNQDKISYIQKVAQSHNISLHVFDDATPILKAADYALLASGTVALEAMLCKTPMVVGYKISPVTYAIVKTMNMMLLPYYSLPNVLYGDFLVPEVLQNNLTAENLYNELVQVADENTSNNMIEKFTEIHKNLITGNNTAAITVMEFLKKCL